MAGIDDILDNEMIEEVVIKPHKNYNWNVFRYIADFTHLAGILILILTMMTNKHCRGVSKKTQILYAVLFVCRYLDLFDHVQGMYLTVFKITFITSSCLAVYLFFLYSRRTDIKSYEVEKDTASATALTIPCIMLAFILPGKKQGLEILWAFSEYLEGVAMVPQYIFCYRDTAFSKSSKTTETGVFMYMMCLGLYKIFYAFNWIYKYIMDPTYSDPQSWIGGMIEISIFFDFLGYQLYSKSLLRSVALKVDDNVNVAVELAEVKIGIKKEEDMVLGGEGTELRRRRQAAEEIVTNPIGQTEHDYELAAKHEMV